jgi:hypothetical protein
MTERTCGACTACCYALGVDAIDKPEFEDCKHLLQADSACGGCDSGCAVYADRPEPCKTYKCLWLDGLIPDEEERPDKLGVVFTPSASKVLGPYVQVTEVIDGAVERDDVRRLIEVLGEHVAVLHIRAEGTRVLVAAPEEVFKRVVEILRAQSQDFKIVKRDRLVRRNPVVSDTFGGKKL